MKKDVKIYALPGFLGRPSDWDFMLPQPIVFDLFDNTFPLRAPWEWAHRFNHDIIYQNDTLNILLGYSLGGRLALHALLDDPTIWDGAIIVSAHPGLSSLEEREQRKHKDADWAHRFTMDPWDKVIESWNNQDPLKGSIAFQRNENDYSRNKLALALNTWSLGRQDDLRKQIQLINIPILWLSGENDTTYSSIAKSITLRNPLSSVKIIPHATHRLPWDQPEHFQNLVKTFIKTVQENVYANSKHHLA